MLVAVAFGVTAGVVAASLVWSWLHQPSEAEQLVEILAGKSVPDAAWAFRKLEDVSDEDLRNLVQYLKDPRTTPLKAVHQKGSMQWDPRGLTLLRLVKRILVSRMPDEFVTYEHRPVDSPESWDQDRWSLEIERLLAERSREHPAEKPKSRRVGLVRPPARSSVLGGRSPDDATRIASLLKGEDAALAVWLVEMLRRSPDEALDGLLAHVSSAEATQVRFFYSEHDPVARAEGFTLGHLVRMLLAERVGDDVLYYNARQYDTPGLAAQVKTAWRERRSSPRMRSAQARES
jgi:hypothetical protein